MKSFRIFPIITAGLGGISPYLVTLSKNLVAAAPHTNVHFSDLIDFEYFAGLALIALIGATVALAFKETDLKKAFILGIGAPALIASTFRDSEQKTTSMAFPNLTTAAYADELPSPSASPSLTSQQYVHIEIQSPIPVTARFFDRKPRYRSNSTR